MSRRLCNAWVRESDSPVSHTRCDSTETKLVVLKFGQNVSNRINAESVVVYLCPEHE